MIKPKLISHPKLSVGGMVMPIERLDGQGFTSCFPIRFILTVVEGWWMDNHQFFLGSIAEAWMWFLFCFLILILMGGMAFVRGCRSILRLMPDGAGGLEEVQS